MEYKEAVFDDDFEFDEDEAEDDSYWPCGICSRIMGDEVAYGDTWDGRDICECCAGVCECCRDED